MFEIELVQGDTSPVYKFQRTDDKGGVITTLPQKMWVTFKKDYKSEKALIQKTLENGIEYNSDDNYYRFKLTPDDTANLCYGKYGFDIAILNENGDKITLLNDGTLKITEHYTRKNNEV